MVVEGVLRFVGGDLFVVGEVVVVGCLELVYGSFGLFRFLRGG